jgi:D-aminopeptidase
LGVVETAVVKQGFAKYGGIVMSAQDSRKLIHKAAATAVRKAAKNKPKPLRLRPPYRVELDVVGQEFVEKKAAMIQGAKVVGTSTIVVEGEDLNRLMFDVFV